MSEFSYDVFLSHNRADKPRVSKLATKLAAAGLRVWFDEWIINQGDDIYLVVENGLQTARTLVLCLSPAALGSDWPELERSSALFRDPSNVDRRFIPLLLEPCKRPDTLRRYSYVDYRKASAAEFKKLVKACLGENASTVRAGRVRLETAVAVHKLLNYLLHQGCSIRFISFGVDNCVEIQSPTNNSVILNWSSYEGVLEGLVVENVLRRLHLKVLDFRAFSAQVGS